MTIEAMLFLSFTVLAMPSSAPTALVPSLAPTALDTAPSACSGPGKNEFWLSGTHHKTGTLLMDGFMHRVTGWGGEHGSSLGDIAADACIKQGAVVADPIKPTQEWLDQQKADADQMQPMEVPTQWTGANPHHTQWEWTLSTEPQRGAERPHCHWRCGPPAAPSSTVHRGAGRRPAPSATVTVCGTTDPHCNYSGVRSSTLYFTDRRGARIGAAPSAHSHCRPPLMDAWSSASSSTLGCSKSSAACK